MKKLALPVALLAVAASCVVSSAGLLFLQGSHPFWPPELTPKVWSKHLEPSPEKTHRRGWYFQYDDVRETLFEIQFDNREDFERI